MIISMDAAKNSESNVSGKPVVYDDVLSGDEWDLDCSCHEFDCVFPACNHTKLVSKENIGYTQGYMDYGRPFEAELFTNYLGEVTLGVVMPILEKEKTRATFSSNTRTKSLPNSKGNILGMVTEQKSWDNSILTIGMVINGEEEDLDIIISYVTYLKKMGIVEFTSNVENCNVSYFTDINGTELVKLLLTLKYNGEVFATTPLNFKPFLGEPRKTVKPRSTEPRKYTESEMIMWPDDDDEYVRDYFAGKHEPYDVVEEHIDNATVGCIKPYQLMAFRYSEGGAMGSDAGLIELICFYGEKIHILKGNHAYGETDMRQVYKVLPEFMHRRNVKTDGWKMVFYDCGHIFYVREHLAADVEKNVKAHIYPEFEELVVKALHGRYSK